MPLDPGLKNPITVLALNEKILSTFFKIKNLNIKLMDNVFVNREFDQMQHSFCS